VGRARWLRATLATIGVAVFTTVAATTVAGTGYGWISALGTPTRAHTWLSITTDLGNVTGYLMKDLGLGTVEQTLNAWWLVGLALAACCCVTFWSRSAQVGPLVSLGLCLSALVLLGPVVHPWYLLWGVVALAAASNSFAIRRAIAITSVALVLLVIPGGVDPSGRTFVGALLGTAAVLIVLAAFSDVDGRHVRAPLEAGPETGARTLAALPSSRSLEPVG
jgi:hypothetical protein